MTECPGTSDRGSRRTGTDRNDATPGARHGCADRRRRPPPATGHRPPATGQEGISVAPSSQAQKFHDIMGLSVRPARGRSRRRGARVCLLAIPHGRVSAGESSVLVEGHDREQQQFFGTCRGFGRSRSDVGGHVERAVLIPLPGLQIGPGVLQQATASPSPAWRQDNQLRRARGAGRVPHRAAPGALRHLPPNLPGPTTHLNEIPTTRCDGQPPATNRFVFVARPTRIPILA